MALRTFMDPAGVEWQVWDVRPEEPYRGTVANAGLEGGWLVFQSESHKRRLCPIPPEWEDSSAEQLHLWCRVASAVHPSVA